MALDSIIITHYDEKHAPPCEDVLRVSVDDGDHVYLTVCDYEETHRVLTLDLKGSICVNIKDLVSAINLLAAASEPEPDPTPYPTHAEQ